MGDVQRRKTSGISHVMQKPPSHQCCHLTVWRRGNGREKSLGGEGETQNGAETPQKANQMRLGLSPVSFPNGIPKAEVVAESYSPGFQPYSGKCLRFPRLWMHVRRT